VLEEEAAGMMKPRASSKPVAEKTVISRKTPAQKSM